MLRLEPSRRALKFVDSLPPKQFAQVFKKILALMKDPYPHDSIEMTGFPFRRADIGEYRIVYQVEGDALKVFVIGKRNDSDVYKALKR